MAKLWVTRDKVVPGVYWPSDKDVFFWPIKTKLNFDKTTGEWNGNLRSFYVMEYEKFKCLMGVLLREGEKCQVEMRKVKGGK